MRDTGNKGVNVVLNSLAGKHQRLGLQALCSSGRFCEIGKGACCVVPSLSRGLFGGRLIGGRSKYAHAHQSNVCSDRR